MLYNQQGKLLVSVAFMGQDLEHLYIFTWIHHDIIAYILGSLATHLTIEGIMAHTNWI